MTDPNSERGFYVYYDAATEYKEDAPLSASMARTLANNAQHMADSPAMQIRINDLAKTDTGNNSTLAAVAIPATSNYVHVKTYVFPWTFRADGTPAVPVLRSRAIIVNDTGTCTIRYILTSDNDNGGIHSYPIAEWTGTLDTNISTVVGGVGTQSNAEGLAASMLRTFTTQEEGADGTAVQSSATVYMARLVIMAKCTTAENVHLKAVHLREHFFG